MFPAALFQFLLPAGRFYRRYAEFRFLPATHNETINIKTPAKNESDTNQIYSRSFDGTVSASESFITDDIKVIKHKHHEHREHHEQDFKRVAITDTMILKLHVPKLETAPFSSLEEKLMTNKQRDEMFMLHQSAVGKYKSVFTWSLWSLSSFSPKQKEACFNLLKHYTT